MNIVKPGVIPNTLMMGQCGWCGCQFECTADETVDMSFGRAIRCPTCKQFVNVHEKTQKPPELWQRLAMFFGLGD